ncbi:alpha/beta fold hydrolase [Rhizobium halophytocola]|uniref:Alpha-beta hydrolase superfamily lysophospholipase n=1 Tax=Rhizobium halophytocola TaxID=735519 RepID=A0ABS4DSJ7_9HYPH|nr:alpha/beta fold hydrolase [Rhizobium halophytocola]MBP1848647.1 alpha-beta hydrolase superfamily lysophospholipase [Rhizobium halophytocola]
MAHADRFEIEEARDASPDATGRASLHPLTFAGTVGHYHPGAGDVGIVVCNPWGYDELCVRKFHRLLGDRLSGQGFPVLRYDHPGEGDALPVEGGAGLVRLTEGALAAADVLRAASGCERVIFYGIGLGATVALIAARSYFATGGLVIAAPVLSGRRYLREIDMRERIIRETLGLDLGTPPDAVTLAGFRMTERLAAELKPLKIGFEGLDAKLPVLVLERPDYAADAELLAALAAAGVKGEAVRFDGYGALMESPTTSVIPLSPIAAIAGWVKARFAGKVADAVPRFQPMHASQHFAEEVLTFGPEPGLFGVLTCPVATAPKATVIYLNTGYGHRIGWGGIWVRAARDLAGEGIASFRLDLSGIGDSPAQPGAPEQVIYSSQQLTDIGHAVRMLKQRSGGPIILVGRCSGAWSALHFAAISADVAAVVSVNQLRLIFDPAENLENALRVGARSLNDYRRRAFDIRILGRILKGEVNLPRAAINVLGQLRTKAMTRLAPHLGPLTRIGRFRRRLSTILRDLEIRAVPVSFANVRDDGSLDQMALYFGPDLSGLEAFSNLSLEIIENADHNLTPRAAQDQLIDIVRRAVDARV